jgi:hypothetical protein
VLGPLDRTSLLLSENPDDHPHKRNLQPGDSFEDTAVKPGLKLSNSKPDCRVLALCEINIPKKRRFDIELIHVSMFQLLIPGPTLA